MLIRRTLSTLATGFAMVILPSLVNAYTVSETLSIGGVFAGAYQYQLLDHDDGGSDEGGGAVAFQPTLSLRPTAMDEFFVKFGFAADNGLNDKPPL
jgi:porin